MISKETESRRHRHRRTVVSSHAIDRDAGCHGKRKAGGPQRTACLAPTNHSPLALRTFLPR
jgi:hypothetical protein